MAETVDSRAPGRLTRHRRAVWQVVRAEPQHLTAAQVYDALHRHDARMAFGTVYNALHYLVAAGLIDEVRRPDGVIAYDRETRPHDHVVCRVCGRLADAPSFPMRERLARSYTTVEQQTGFTVEHHRVEFVGVCPSCS